MRGSLAIFAASNGFLAVLLGAFGAHALKHRVPANLLAVWQTAVQYQMYHALAILVIVGMHSLGNSRHGITAAGLLGLGMLLFSGSLYLLVLTGLEFLGAVTPVGGICFLAGWLVLVVAFCRQENRHA